MCKKPLTIINRGYLKDDPFSPYYVSVPCGRCDECQQQRVSDVLFRADYEYADTIKSGGNAFFLTLTFNDANLNWYTYSDGSKCSTWNSILLQKFTHRLHTYLSRNGFSFKYLITSERGKNGTKRPHYHCVFFICPLLRDMPDDTFFYSLFARFWSLSRNDVSNPLSGGRWSALHSPIGLIHVETIQRTQLEAMKYVCKYAFKDLGDSLFSFNESDIVSSSHCVPYCKAVPRSFFSKNIGSSFWRDIELKDIPAFFASFYSHQSDGKVTSIPRYYVRKFLYTSSTLFEEYVHDTSKTFDGHAFVNRFPLVKVGDKFQRSRLKKTTCSIRLPAGDKYLSLVRLTRFSYFYSWLHNFQLVRYDSKFLSSLAPSLARQYRLFLGSLDLFNAFLSSCRSLQFQDLYDMYLGVLHRSNLDNISDRRICGCSPIHDQLAYLLSVFQLHNMLSGTSTFYQNQLRFKNFLPDAVKKRPLLFVPKD